MMNSPKNLPLYIFVMACSFLMTSVAQGQDPHMKSTELSTAVSSGSFEELDWFPCPAPLDFEGCHIAILHGDPSKPNSDVLFRMQPGTTAKEHWHSSAERMILISGELHVTYEGEETQVLKSGSYAYGPSQKPHVALCVGEEPCVLFIAFEEPVDTYADDGN